MKKDNELLAEAYQKVLEATYDQSHNSPYDRGGADSYYRRGKDPHFYIKNADGTNRRVEKEEMTPEQIEAYIAGYDDNEKAGDFKDYSE